MDLSRKNQHLDLEIKNLIPSVAHTPEPDNAHPSGIHDHHDPVPASTTQTEDRLVPGARIIYQHRWREMMVEVHEKPANIPPTLISSALDPKIILQLSGATHLRSAKGGMKHHSLQTGKGLLSVLAPNQPEVELEWTERSPTPPRFLYIHLDHNVLAATAAEEADLDIARVEMPTITDLDDPLLRQLGFALVNEMQQPEAHNELYADTVARMLTMQLLHRHGAVRALEAKTPRNRLSSRCLRLLNEHVRAHLQESITLESLAAIAGMSRSCFCRAFRYTTGQTPNQYVIAQRMEHAARLLRRTDLTVAHIATLVGYRSVSQFGSLFRRHTRYSPGMYARRVP